MAERCVVYVDGYNFYYAISEHPEVTPLYLGWCDFAALARQSLLGPGSTLERVKYFTAPVGDYAKVGGPGGGEAARQRIWLAALRAVAGVEIVAGVHTGKRGVPRSRKETDVNIAIAAVVDAARDRLDRAVLLTGDRDQRPTVEVLVKEFGKRVDVWLAPSQHKGFWRDVETGLAGVRVRKLTPDMLRRARLPEHVTVDGEAADLPPGWRAPL